MPLFRCTVDLWYHMIDPVPSASVRARRIVAMLSSQQRACIAIYWYPGSRYAAACNAIHRAKDPDLQDCTYTAPTFYYFLRSNL